jgi:hypothetical protein
MVGRVVIAVLSDLRILRQRRVGGRHHTRWTPGFFGRVGGESNSSTNSAQAFRRMEEA